LIFRIQQRSTAGEAVFDPVPVADGFLAVLPAEIDDLFSHDAREVDEPLLHALADASQAVDLLHERMELAYQSRDVIVLSQSFHETGTVGFEPFAANDRFAGVSEPSEIPCDSLHQGPKAGEKLVGFLNGKKTGGLLRSHRNVRGSSPF
jgi:hypothetical protein